jgi:hypothetical protein
VLRAAHLPLVIVALSALTSACVEPPVAARPCGDATDCLDGFSCVERVCIVEPPAPRPDPDPEPEVTIACAPANTFEGGDFTVCGAPTPITGRSTSADGRLVVTPRPGAPAIGGTVAGGDFQIR